MKNLIVFSTKYGSVEVCAQKLQHQVDGETTLVNVKTDPIPNLQEFDTVILGGSIYVGKIQQDLTNFMETHLDTLLQKRIALFICAGQEPDVCEQELQDAFPPKLAEHAIARECFGGYFDLKKVTFLEKLVLKAKGVNEESASLSEDAITRLSRAVSEETQ